MRTAVLGIALCAGLEVQALDPAKPLREYNCQVWTHQNGLPVNAVNALAQSVDGYIWLGTHQGLVRFDGRDFQVLGSGPWEELRAVSVPCVCASGQGGVWFGVERSGFGHYDTESGWQWGDSRSGAMWGIRCLAEEASGVLWAGGESLRRRIKGKTEVVADPPIGEIVSLHTDQRGRTWIGTVQRGLYYVEAGRVSRVRDESLNGNIIFAITSDREGNLWLGTQVGVICLDRNLQRRAVRLPEYEVRALCADSQGCLWLGTTGGGLLRWVQGQWEQFRKADGLCEDWVLSLLEDREGSLWVGTRNGLAQLTDVKFPLVSESQGVTARPVLSVSPARDGSLWLATAHGIVNFNGWGHLYGSTLSPPVAYTNYTKRVFQARDGDLYVLSGMNEVMVLAEGKPVARLVTTNMPVALAEDTQGMVVSVGGELFRANRKGLTPFLYKQDKKPELYWISNLWVGEEEALWVASVNGFARIQDGEFQHWTQQEGLADNNVRWIMQDREGTVWVGTATALARLREGRITNFRRHDGLPFENIQCIMDDEMGNLWVNTTSGLFQVGKGSLEAFAKGATRRVECIRHDGPESVKPMDHFEQEATGCRTVDGRIWFPRANGALVINPTNIPMNRLEPLVRMQVVRANGVELTPFRGQRVPPGEGTLEFRFAALSYIAPGQIRYRYQLAGVDADWIEAGNRRGAAYANLKPGRYQFRVTACNADGIWSRQGDEVAVVLLPHFYQTSWFYGLCGLAGAGVLGGLYGWRVRRISQKERAAAQTRAWLEAQVRERTEELEKRRAELESEIEERKRVQEQLITASRQAGMAEVATGVLHNVGNVLNSVNVSASLIRERVHRFNTCSLTKVCALLEGHRADLGSFLSNDPKGRRVPEYLTQLARVQEDQQTSLVREVSTLVKNVDHIKEIVAMQQSYAKVGGVIEDLSVAGLIEDALSINGGAFLRDGVTVRHEFEAVPPVRVDKHKVLQILVNLLRNAHCAMQASERADKLLTLGVSQHGGGRVKVTVRDNGIGIAPENLIRIFNHGFTTKKDGHGFGLHSGALAAKEMGGSLQVCSEGVNLGATFILELPIAPEKSRLE